jgi:very-short-patch-repair endonuclease
MQVLGATSAWTFSLGKTNSKAVSISSWGKTLPRQQVPPSHRSFARAMRADATKAEDILWQALRNKQLEGVKFKRQVPLDDYILDFVCFEARLIVQVDGGQHNQSMADLKRDRHFELRGFKIVRFWNNEVERNIDGTYLEILGEARARLRNN